MTNKDNAHDDDCVPGDSSNDDLRSANGSINDDSNSNHSNNDHTNNDYDDNAGDDFEPAKPPAGVAEVDENNNAHDDESLAEVDDVNDADIKCCGKYCRKCQNKHWKYYQKYCWKCC